MRTRIVTSLLFLLLALALLVPSPARAGLVTNGGFETGHFSPWTQSGDLSSNVVSSSNAHSGTYEALFETHLNLGSITQTLVTIPGQTYELSFWLRHGSGSDSSEPDNQWLVSWGGAQLDGKVGAQSFDWTQYVHDVVASGSATDLSFGFYDPVARYILDDINVIPKNNDTPEPASMLLVGASLVALGLLCRRRPHVRVPVCCRESARRSGWA